MTGLIDTITASLEKIPSVDPTGSQPQRRQRGMNLERLHVQRNASSARNGPTSNEHVDEVVPQVDLVMLPPEKAQEWLDTNPVDRNVRQQHVDKIARDIEQGEWHTNGDPIRFNQQGVRIDGQHRLLAIVQAGIPVQTFVAYNVSDEAHHTIDTGKARTLSDELKYREEPNPTALAATVRLYWFWENNSLRRQTSEAGTREYLDVLRRHPGLRKSTTVGQRLSKVSQQCRVTAFMHYLLSRIDEDEADEFFRQLQAGTGLEHDSGVFQMREWLMSKKAKNQLVVYTCALYIKAWNAYIKGTPIKSLRWRMGGGNPEVFPEPVSPDDF